MWPYVLLIVCPIILHHAMMKSFNGSTADVFQKNSDKAMRLFWGILLVLLAIRHENVGIDLHNYHSIFNSICRSSWEKALGRSLEIGYSALNKIISLFTNDFRWIIVVSAVLSVVFIARVYIRFSSDASLSIALFISMSNFIMLFSGLRQAIAISLGFLAFEFVRNKKLLFFLPVVVVAMLFHTSAFMLLLMYPLYHARITKNSLVVIVPAMAFVLIFNEQIFGLLGTILSRYTKYDATISSTGAYTMLLLFIVFAVFAYLIPDESKLDRDTIGLRNFLLLAVVLQMFASLHSLAMRMNYYYIAFIPLLLPKIIEYRSKTWNQIAVVARYAMIAFFVAFFFITAPNDNSLQTFPYRFFWEDLR